LRHTLTRGNVESSRNRHCEPTGRANARPMTAKQSMEQLQRKLDCFVARAPRNDGKVRLRDLAAMFARGLPLFPALSNQRAQGMPGARSARRRMCSGDSGKSAHALVRSHRNRPAFPTQWFTAYGVLASAVACSTVAGRSLHRLEASIGCIGTTRFCRPPQAPLSEAPSASTAARPALLTFAQRPSEWDGMASDIR
jgi:hypothetical protein